jgi:hypothetical protein
MANSTNIYTIVSRSDLDNSSTRHSSINTMVSSYDGVSAPIALAGSSLSAITTFCVIICFAIWHRTHRTFRHALVFNLALAGKHTPICRQYPGT